jgi:hypothetical protein
MSSNVNECEKPLPSASGSGPAIRGLHSSTFQLNLSRF